MRSKEKVSEGNVKKTGLDLIWGKGSEPNEE